MSSLQSKLKTLLPQNQLPYWYWEMVNVFVPIIGILLFNWDIFEVVYLFWIEVLLWGFVGVLQIISAKGIIGGWLNHAVNKIGSLLFYVVLYIALFTILFSFTFIELSSDTILNGGSGIGIGLIVLTINYLINYYSSEIASKRYQTRFPMEVIFQRFIYALPLALLIVFGVVPLAKKFDGANLEKVIAIGIIIAKFVMSYCIHFFQKIFKES